MANFHTHFKGAISVGIASTAILYCTHLINASQVVPFVALVALSGILPDVDSDHSDSIKITFDLIGIVIASVLSLTALPSLGFLSSAGIFILIFALIRFASIVPFRELTAHRGIFHSIPMAAVFALGTCVFEFYVMKETQSMSWLSALMIVIGFLTHLTLDEIYSVNLANVSLKKSFGTALKFYSKDNKIGYLILYILIVILFAVAPHPLSFADHLKNVLESFNWY